MSNPPEHHDAIKGMFAAYQAALAEMPEPQLATGEDLDRIASLYVITRMTLPRFRWFPWWFRRLETDAELRTRCLAYVRGTWPLVRK